MTARRRPGGSTQAQRDVERYAAHVNRLLVKHKIALVVRDGSGGRANGRARYVVIPPVTTVYRYATAMHELGHIVGRGRSARTLEAEAAAWAWASRNALPGATSHPSWVRNVRSSLASYLMWACRRNRFEWTVTPEGRFVVDTSGGHRRGCPTVPPEGHAFWSLLETGAP